MILRALFIPALGVLACSSAPSSTDGGADARTEGKVDVSGGVVNHSLNRLAMMKTGRTVELSGLTVELFGQGALAAGGAALATTPLATGCTAMSMCRWMLPGVALPGDAPLVRIKDTRATPLWVTTATINDFSSRADQGVGFAFSRDALDTALAPLVGLSGDEVLARGLVFGLIYNGRTGDGSGMPVVGATVAASNGAQVLYPTGNFMGTGAATANQGVFLLVAPPGGSSSVTFTITPPSGQTLSWDPAQAALLSPGSVYFALLFAR